MKTGLVRAGYDRIAGRYAERRGSEHSIRYLERLDERLGAESRILDLGCGAGVPVDRYLVDRGHDVIGLDFCDPMLALARRNVPEADYRTGDMAELRARDYSVDAVVSFFAVIHVDRRHHERLFRVIRSFLPRGGPILVTMGERDWEGDQDFLGVPMAWLRAEVKAGQLPHLRVGRRYFVEVDEVRKALSERTRQEVDANG